MSKFFGSIKADSTGVSLPINLSSATGAAVGDLTFQYWRQGESPVTVALVALDDIDAPWESAGWIEMNPDSIPAIYRLDVPDAAFIAGADWVEIIVSLVSGDGWYTERFSLTPGGGSAGEVTTEKQTAADRVALLSAASSFPAVTNDEILALLDDCQLATVWAPDTSYAAGDAVIPTEDNVTGLWYVLVAGWSANPTGATEPTWPQYQGGPVSDNGLLWRCRGEAPRWLWDLRQCEHLVYGLKLARAATVVDAELDQRDRFASNQVVKNLRDLYEQTAPFCVA